MMTSKEIRQKWLDFFASKGHLVVPSKSLIPINDPSLLWINSGVATLKDYFSGKKIPPAKRITNSQKSIRTNDIENVGVTARHHTFFEMLGNFSIGDYFKKEAINFAYEFLFDVLKFSKEKIYITYYSEDKDTFNYWTKNGIDPSHMIKGTRDTNFWDVGQGPCGPDTEIFYDRGEKFDKKGIELLEKDIENDRYIEIWNIVFSQFNNDGENNYTDLATKNIDTGAGLERIVSILQDAPTNFDTDLFLPIIHEVEKLTTLKYDISNYFKKDPKQTKINTYFKIIADHMRASVNAINDGVLPSNVGRGYIIRRLIRRSYRAGLALNIKQKTFLYKLTKIVKDSLIYDIDVKKVSEIIKSEEELFAKTINDGEKLIEQEILKNGTMSVEAAFKMFDTYGFPIELTKEILKEKNIKYTWTNEDYQKFITEHQDKSRSNVNVGMQKAINSLSLVTSLVSEFVGYEHLTVKNSKILYMLNEEKQIWNTNKITDKCYLILDKTPFYATSGGQNHDFGYMMQGKNKIKILDVFKDKYWNPVHLVEGIVDFNKPIDCFVDTKSRAGFARGHSATHLMYHAIRQTYPHEKIEQLGSNINPEHFTFDFGLDHRPTKDEVRSIEKIMREYIAKKANRTYIVTTIKNAEKLGAWMTIEESEYHDANKVRVVKFDDITLDLCGGTHVQNSQDIEDFKIISVDSKGTGVYRLRVITSTKDVHKYLDQEIKTKIELLTTLIKNNQQLDNSYKKDIPFTKTTNTLSKEKLLDYYDALENELREDYKKLLKQKQNIKVDLNSYIPENINGKKVFIIFENDPQSAKKVAVELRENNQDALIISLGNIVNNNETCFLVVASKTYNANKFFVLLTKTFDGKGGGNNIICQGSIKKPLSKEDLLKVLKKELDA